MEPLPSGAQFVREKMLWEIALGLADDPSIPYYGNRDISIVVGNGSAQSFTASVRMAPGSPILSHAVVRGDLDLAFVNPSALLTQAYRGTGLYDAPLPVRIVASYPSWDRFVVAVHPRLGIRSLADLADLRLPVRISVREDVTHSTRVLIDQLLPMYGFALADAEAWGATLQLNGPPMDRRRLAGLEDGSIDVVFDEGIRGWLPTALRHDLKVLPLEPEIVTRLEAIGWRRAILPKEQFPDLDADLPVIDYSGWPLYTRASLPDEVAYNVCEAIAKRAEQIPWDSRSFQGPHRLGEETEATPRDVPLHPGAERWYREHGSFVGERA
jgi:TRAP-type uncharacterized transport system substrate-binding protein